MSSTPRPDLPPALPAGLTSRPLTRADVGAVTAVMAAQERHDLGRVEIEEADIVGDWQRPGYVVEESTVGVLDAAGALVAYAELGHLGRCDTAVHPDQRGRGVGTWLAHWLREQARARGVAEIGMPVPQGSDADRLLEALGFHVRWTSWILELPSGTEIVERPLPAGLTVRAARAEEHRAAHAVVDAAFLEWSDREPEPFEDFAATVLGRPGFEAWNLRVVVGPGEEVLGAAVVSIAAEPLDGGPQAFISRLAVRADLRRRGLAQALMVDAFAAAREHGAASSSLSTDSRTGALGLYDKVGMVVTSTWVNRATRPL